MSTQDLIVAAAGRYGVPSDLALRVAKQESGYQQNRVSKAGAIGVMQLMPATAADLGVDPYDEGENIDGGVRYLSEMYAKFGDWDKALAAYNAGPGTVQKVLAGSATLPAETQNYVLAILGQPFGQAPPGDFPPGQRRF